MQLVVSLQGSVLAAHAVERLRSAGFEAHARFGSVDITKNPSVFVTDGADLKLAWSLVTAFMDECWTPYREGEMGVRDLSILAPSLAPPCPKCGAVLPLAASVENCPSCGTSVCVEEEIALAHG